MRLGELPKTDKPEFLATVTSEHPRTGDRGWVTVTGRDEGDLDRNVIEEIGNLRSRGHRPVKTEMHIDGHEWVYEYNTSGEIERIFHNGEVTP